jgi:transposase
MDTEQDLFTLSQETLVEIILQLRVANSELQKELAELKAQSVGRHPPGMPGNKPTSTTRKQARKATRKPRAKGFARCRTTPTQKVEHKLDRCPDCGTALSGGWVHKTREVIEVPVVPAQVTEHVLVGRQCPQCNQAKVPKVELEGVVAGEQRLGINLVSLIVTLKEEARLPVRQIKWYLHTVHQLDLSVGCIIDLCQRVAHKAKEPVEQIRDQIRTSPVVHADETGWRQDGNNGYVWIFCSPTACYFIRAGRSKAVVDMVLGENSWPVLVTDFYAAYNHYPGLHQRCWSHLLRDIHELKVVFPDDQSLDRWAQGVHALFLEAKVIKAQLVQSKANEADCCSAQLRLEEMLLRLCRPYLGDEGAVQGRLCRRIERHIKELFVFVARAEVPADNNAAERGLRHLVTSRKISGGTRSDKGSETKMILSSLFGTWRLQQLNPFLQCRAMLASPAS